MNVSITIRDVPEQTRNELAARASRSGRSFQEYVRLQLVGLAERPDPESLFSRIRERKQRTGSRMTSEAILELRDDDRR